MNAKQIGVVVWIVIAFGLGVFARIWWINNIPNEQQYDFETYYEVAVNISEGKKHTLDGSPIAWQGCGYSFALGTYYKITGDTSIHNGKIFNIIISSVTLILALLLYFKLFRNMFIIATCFSVTAFFPNLIAYTNVLGTETLSLFIITAILVVYTYLRFKPALYVLLGILCACGAFTKPYLLAYPVILGIVKWVKLKNVKESLILLCSVYSIVILCISPWVYRNYKLFNRFIPISYNGGYVLYVNNNSSNINGMWMNLTEVKASIKITNEINKYLEDGKRNIKFAHDLEPYLKSLAQEWIMENPIEFLKLGFLRVKATFFYSTEDIFAWSMNKFDQNFTNWDEEQHTRNIYAMRSAFDMCLFIISSSAFLFIVVNFKSYLLACFTLKHRIKDSYNLIYLSIAFFIVVFFVYEGHPRYNIPTIILLISAFGLVLEKLTAKPRRLKAPVDQE